MSIKNHPLVEIVLPFYNQCLTVNANSNPAEIMQKVLADGFKSQGSVEVKTKEQLMAQVQFFWKLIPNLQWVPQEVLVDGNKVIVRSLASGNPKGEFFGMPVDGTKAFKIMSIDIHTVENGQIQSCHHVEEWAVAMKQLKG